MVMSWSPSTSPRPQSLPSPSTVSLFPTTTIITAINTNSTYPTALFTHWSSSMRHCAIFNITMTILMFFILLIIIIVVRKLLCLLFCCAAFWISLKKIMSSSCATLLSGNVHCTRNDAISLGYNISAQSKLDKSALCHKIHSFSLFSMA